MLTNERSVHAKKRLDTSTLASVRLPPSVYDSVVAREI